MGECAAAVQLIDVFDADECGRATVSVYDARCDRVHDVAVSYLPDLGMVEIPGECPPPHVAHFIERDRAVRELVELHFRSAVEAYDPR